MCYNIIERNIYIYWKCAGGVGHGGCQAMNTCGMGFDMAKTGVSICGRKGGP